jgi:hypothetical protein
VSSFVRTIVSAADVSWQVEVSAAKVVVVADDFWLDVGGC